MNSQIIKVALLVATALPLVALDRPNVLWITTEDMSPNLGSYGDPDARTPNLDTLAENSVRFTQAFATAPVCSPVRSTLITGMYAVSLGSQRLRSQFPYPEEVHPFPAKLRELGYYCTNNVKTDYNVENEPAFIAQAWNESSPTAHWRDRAPNQSFFSVINLMTTHQSRTAVWPRADFEREVGSTLKKEERHDPDALTLPSFYPDTAEARQAWARYLDCITAMDRQVGEILDQLEEDGLADDTIVFFFSDHGMGMPRGKRTLYDSGLQVPLLIHVPEKWQRQVPAPAGTTSDELVSFIDFAPTVLTLCGVGKESYQPGRVFLGQNQVPAREFIYAARDRVDEVFDVARAIRDSRWLYIRNHMPHLPWMQPCGYSDTDTFIQELHQRDPEAGPSGFTGFAQAPRPLEELYDTVADPDQLNNLAKLPEHRITLDHLRKQLRQWQLDTRDLGYLTEPMMEARINREKMSPRELAKEESRYALTRLLTVADAVGTDEDSARQRAWLRDPDDAVRYWATVGLNARPSLTKRDIAALYPLLQDRSPTVRIEAAATLAKAGETEASLPVLGSALHIKNPTMVVLHAARAIELLGPVARPLYPEVETALGWINEAANKGDDYAMFTRFSLKATLPK